MLKDVPLWLDEGLAEYYELPPSWNGLNRMHVEELHRRGSPSRPDTAGAAERGPGHERRPEYREAWAWVHLMLRTSPKAKEVLLAYLQQLRTKPNPGPLQPRLAAAVPAYNEALEHLLAQIGRRAAAGSDRMRT